MLVTSPGLHRPDIFAVPRRSRRRCRSARSRRRHGRTSCPRPSAAARAPAVARCRAAAETSPMRSAISITAPTITNSARPIASGAKVLPPNRPGPYHRDHKQRRNAGRHQTLGGAEQIAALPGQQRTKGQRDQQRNKQRSEGEIEERRADRNLLARHHFQRQRIKRSDKDRRTGRRQQQIIENQRALPARSARTDRPA